MLSPPSKTGRGLVAVTLAILVIFGGLVAGITWRLRAQLRQEVLRREAEAIQAVALMQLGSADLQLAEFGEEFVIDDLFAAVLKSSELRGVVAVQLFDAKGELRKAHPLAADDAASTRWWAPNLTEPAARFMPDASLEMVSPQLALQASAVDQLPLLEIAVPLITKGTGAPLGVGRYWLNGAPVAAEFARMNRWLGTQAMLALGVGVALAFAFFRLAQANRRLAEQSADLERANEELDFAAKTGALGAISAHLIHGLKNPLAGIEGFVAETTSGDPDAVRGEAGRIAVETTRRLRALVNEVATVMRDETEGSADFPVPAADVVHAARQRALPTAERAGVELTATAPANARVSARTANLAGLVLANLVANAIEACSNGGGVAIEGGTSDGRVEFVVRDTGPGLPQEVQSALFRPVRSTKRGGGGVGLAICHRLAKHAAGELRLMRSDSRGTEFRLSVPAL